MGRTVAETVERVDGEHHLVTAGVHDGTELFAGSSSSGGAWRRSRIGRSARADAAPWRELRPDVVHLHGGALGPLLAAGTAHPRPPPA